MFTPKQIAKLITENPNEYAGLEDADEFGEESYVTCNHCGHDYDNTDMNGNVDMRGWENACL